LYTSVVYWSGPLAKLRPLPTKGIAEETTGGRL
jgi:hypothetical protein